MLQNLITAINVVLPIFILIGIGYFLRFINAVEHTSLKQFNKLVFKLFLPALLFENMYNSKLDHDFNFNIVTFAISTILIMVALLCVLVPLFEKDKSKRSTIIQGMYRSNFALVGIALTESMYGVGNTEISGLLVVFVVPLFNLIAVCLFEFYRGNSLNPLIILKGIISNPLIIGTVLGVMFSLLNIQIPYSINHSIAMLGNLAAPIALIILGGTFSFKKVIKNEYRLIAVNLARLVVIPALFIYLAILFGFRDKELFALFTMYATPTAVVSYAMASAMGGDGELAGQIVVTTTVSSLFTCILGIFGLQTLGYI